MAFVNAVYYPSWRIYKGHTPFEIPADHITELFYAFARPQSDGGLALLDPHADLNMKIPGSPTQGCIATCISLKEAHPHLKVLLSIGGASGSGPFGGIASQYQTRACFAKNVRSFVDEHGFDGADVDWEHPSDAQQGADYLDLMRELRAQLPRERYVLSTALPVGEYVLKHIDMGALACEIDLFNLMAYDFAGAWSGLSGHHAQLHAPSRPINAFAARSGAQAVEYLTGRGMPRAKIVLGVPTYARTFTGVTGPGQKFEKAGEMEVLDSSGLGKNNVDRDESLCAASTQVGRDWLTFDDTVTVSQKACMVKEWGLGGVFFWTSYGDSNRQPSLARTAGRILNNPQ